MHWLISGSPSNMRNSKLAICIKQVHVIYSIMLVGCAINPHVLRASLSSMAPFNHILGFRTRGRLTSSRSNLLPPTTTNTCGAAPASSGCSWNRWVRTGVDWAHQVQAIVDHPRDRQAKRLIQVCDNLSTHTYASLFRAFPTAEARRLARRVTPRHGSWLHRAEPELRVLTRQALASRIATQEAVHAQVVAWAEDRNAAQTGIDWQFRTEDARVRLKHLYPVIEI